MDMTNSQFTRDFKSFVDEFRATNKIELAANLARTKYQSNVASDDETREKQLHDMNKTLKSIMKSLAGEKTTSKKVKEDKEEKITLKDELKSFVAGIKSFGSGIASVVKSPIKAARVGVKQAARTAEGLVTGFEDILNTPKEFSVAQPSSAKQTIEKTKPVSINPEADNVETPAEKMADAAEENVGLQKELLDTTKSSLLQLVAIKDALTAPTPTAEPARAQPTILGATGEPLAPSVNLSGPSKTIKPTPASVPSTMGGKPAAKPTIGSRIGGALKGAGRAAMGAARFLGPIGAAAGAAYGAVEGVGRAQEIFGVAEGKEATVGQKAAAAVGGIADPFGLGYGDSVAKGVHSVGEKIGNFFGFGGKKEEQPKAPITIDMGNGEVKVVNPDGSYEMKGGYGVKKYDKEGNLVSETTPSFMGASKTTTASGDVTKNLSAGALTASETTNAAGNVTGKSASYDMGTMRVSSVEAAGRRTNAADIRTGTGENITLRDEMAATSRTTQPIISNNIQSTSTNTYIPMKADPRPTHRGSALERYNERLATY